MVAGSPFKGRRLKKLPAPRAWFARAVWYEPRDECGRAPEASADPMSDDPNNLDANTPKAPRDPQPTLDEPEPAPPVEEAAP